MKRKRLIEAQRIFSGNKPKLDIHNVYSELEPKEVSLVNKVVYREEV